MERFFAELDKFNAATQPVTRHHLEEHICDAFGVTKAPLVLDMSGFSQLTTRYGIIHYLGMVRRCGSPCGRSSSAPAASW
jgi:hypothetical protein